MPLFMRTLAGPVLAIAMTFGAAPAQAQTYDPNYPICLQVFGRVGNAIGCGYTSMAQCRLSASGRAAQCITNPYFTATNSGRGRRQHRRQ
jgi:hypothetical protein